MKDPLVVYTSIPHGASASYYYRLAVPIKTAAELGLNVKSIVDTNDIGIRPEVRIQNFCEADIVLIYQPMGDIPMNNIRGVQSFIPSKRDGKWKWPPTVILETDDNLFNVSPLNPAFRNLGIRDLNGKDIPAFSEDGRPMQVGMMKGGEPEVLWQQGENGFDLRRNRQMLDGYRQMLSLADAITCSTEAVKKSLLKEVTPRRVGVFPNVVRFNDYEQVDLKEDPDTIKILWQGGAAHFEDWFPLREALGNITRKYPQVHWVIWGSQYHWVNELIPPHRYTYKDWCPYNEYRLRLAMIGHDISLAPLQNHVFNECRSAIKFYEASVLKKDIATLAQRSGDYKNEIIEGQTGLMFDTPEEFEDALSLLIEDQSLRLELGRNAKDWVHENRDAMKKVPELVSYWEQLREERKLEQPHVSDTHWDEIQKEAEAEEKATEAAPA
jgi:glycosyltransferase involved in cell wall biosynthesis